MDETIAYQLSHELMENSDAVYLTTIDNQGFPQTRAMLNLRNTKLYDSLINVFKGHADDLLIYFTTNTSSIKMEQIKLKKSACAYFCRPKEWRGLMLQGNIEIITDPAIKQALWQDNWTMYYPTGVNDPEYTILCLKPLLGKGYHQLNSYTLNFAGEKCS